MIYFCCDEKRRLAVKARAGLNGIDFLEVVDSLTMPLEQRQRTLLVHFLKADGVASLKPEHIRFEGGSVSGTWPRPGSRLMPSIRRCWPSR